MPDATAAAFLRGCARAGLLWPVAMAFAVVGNMFAWPVVATLGAIAVAAALHLRTRSPKPPPEAGSRWEWLALAGVLALAIAPAVPAAIHFAGGDWPRGFTNADEAYNFMIARALQAGFPPADLGYAGRPAIYHVGGPALSQLLSSMGVSLQAAFFAIAPIVGRVLACACVFTILASCVPRLRTSVALGGVLACNGIFLLHPYNVLWNARDIAVNGAIDAAPLLSGMPVAERVGDLLSGDMQYGAPLAVLTALLILANMKTAHWGWLGVALFAMFLAKSSVFVPFGSAWGLVAIVQWVRARDWRMMASAALALGLCLAVRPFVFEPGPAALAIGAGHGFDWLARRGAAAAGLMSLPPGGWAAAAFGAVFVALGSHVFGWLAVRRCAAASWSDAMQSLLPAMFLATVLFATFTVFRLDPVALERFNAVHAGVRELLWQPFDTYMYEQWKLSIQPAEILAGTAFALTAIAGACSQLSCPSRARRWIAIAALGVAAATGAGELAWATLRPDMTRWKFVTPQTVEALEGIPVARSVVLTNDCAYDARVERHLPLMNAAMPAVRGHQFWACNFMFGNNATLPDSVWRLRQHEWFWRTPPGAQHAAFLRAAGISHLLLARRLDVEGKEAALLDAQPWLAQKVKNAEFAVYEVRP